MDSKRCWIRPVLAAAICLACLLALFAAPSGSRVDEATGDFTYTGWGGIDDTLGQIALYLIHRNRMDGSAFVSPEIEEGIVGYQLRFFDNGNRTIDRGDWMSVRRYRIPADPDTTQPANYFKSFYLELVDVGLDGMNTDDYYFISGRRFELRDQPQNVLEQYRVQIESGVSAFVRDVGYNTILNALGAGSQTAIQKTEAYEDGSLPAKVALGVDLRYVFRPIVRNDVRLDEQQTIGEIRQRVGFVYSAITGYTDIQGYQFREIANHPELLNRDYDEVELPILVLVLEALFDTDGDGIIKFEDIKNGYERFRVIHQELSQNTRGMRRKVVLPSEKLSRIRQEYKALRKKEFKL